MNERSLESIKQHLQNKDVQERVRQNIQRGREEATVTIGRAARLFNFTENKLRDWETLGLLKPLRSKDVTGQRQYSPDELDKLAIIKELVEEAGYLPSAIPPDIDKIWSSILNEQQEQASKISEEEAKHLHIDQRVDTAYEELFWRYYASHVLRLSLMLICEDIPDTIAGLMLPLQQNIASDLICDTRDLPRVGKSLIGWLGLNRSFYTFLDSAPSFEYPTDFRVNPLKAVEEDRPKDSTLLVVQRKVKPLSLDLSVVETIRRLLAPLYEVKDWEPYFGQGMRDLLYSVPDFTSNTYLSDDTLNGFADILVNLGGQSDDGQQRWRFCCILLPEESSLPLQQRSLVVRAQSKYSPHKWMTTISPGKYVNSLSLRAFQSGRIIYRREVSNEESAIALRELEKFTHSAIAVPVGGEKGQPLAILYVASNKVDAFSKDDQRVLRMMGRIVEELLMTYHARHQITEKLGELITSPSIVDPLFGDFLSENEFIDDVEALLSNIKKRMDEKDEHIHEYGQSSMDYDTQFRTEQSLEEVVSFIGIDVDNQSSLANMYGDRTTRNLSRTIGLRVQEMVQALITKHTDCKLYHIYADRYYLLLKGISLEQARTKAEAIRQALEGHISIEQPTPPARTLVLPNITIRLGVTSYTYKKLEENLVSDSQVNIVAEVRAKIARALDAALSMGKDEGGNAVISWDRETGGFVYWSPKRNREK